MKSYDAFLKSPYRSDKHSTYFSVYDQLFSRFAGTELTFVEIGVLNGGSLFMWRNLLGEKARIIGIELNPDAKRWEKEGFEIFIGSQSDPEFWKDFFAKVGPIDVLLDDGGHTFEQQIITMEAALPHIRDGGLLVVEDTHTSYMPEFGGPSPVSFVNYAKNIVDGINYRFGRFANTRKSEAAIYSAQFFESFVAFQIDRKLCGVKSEPVTNAGQTFDAKDYRYADSAALTMLQTGGGKYQTIKNTPGLGPLAVAVWRLISPTVLKLSHTRRFSQLKKHFRF